MTVTLPERSTSVPLLIPGSSRYVVPTGERDWLFTLIARLCDECRHLEPLDEYYEGTQPLSYMHPELLQELEGRIRQVVINWPRLVVDSTEERLDVEGFRQGADEDTDDELWQRWQANDLDEGSQLGHLDALVFGRSYAVVGAPEDIDDAPLVTVESPLQMIADHDPKTRRVRAAVKMWTEGRTSYATLYLPNATIWYEQRVNDDWRVVDRDDHMLGVVPVVPLTNRGRTLRTRGVSDLADVLPLSDAANKIATDMMIGAEYHAIPRRYVFGMSKDDFVDSRGNPLPVWSAIAGRLWASPNTDAKAGQFPESDLANFHSTIRLLAERVAELTGMPPHYLGNRSENPPSADAIRSSEARLVRRAERKQRALGGAWERVMRLVRRFETGEWDRQLRALETVWADPATPTLAQKSDAAVKLVNAGIIPAEYAREMIQIPAAARRRIRDMDTQATQRVLAGDLAALAAGPKPGERGELEPAGE